MSGREPGVEERGAAVLEVSNFFLSFFLLLFFFVCKRLRLFLFALFYFMVRTLNVIFILLNS